MHIEFFSTVPGVADAYPIIPASEFDANWIQTLKTEYINTKQTDAKVPSLYKCPGIFDLFNYGFIVPAFTDITVETDNIKNIDVRVPSEKVSDIFSKKNEADIIQFHSYENVAKHFPYKPNTFRALLKFNSPWNIVAPEGIKFIVLPIAYPDEMVFEQTIGILDPAVSCEINAQMYWHKIGDKHLIKAGTPLLHIIPLTHEKVTFECRDATAHDMAWREKFMYYVSNSFNAKRGLLKKFYYKHFKKPSKCPFHFWKK